MIDLHGKEAENSFRFNPSQHEGGNVEEISLAERKLSQRRVQ